MGDKFTRGFLSGIVGGLVANSVSIVFGFLHLTTLRFADWTGIIILGHIPPFSIGEFLFALAVNIGFMGFLGIIFAYLIVLVKSTNLHFKGWIFSTSIWFFIYAATALFKVEGTIPLPLTTVMSNFVTTSILGLVLAQTFGKEEIRVMPIEKGRTFKIMNPAMKPIENPDDDAE